MAEEKFKLVSQYSPTGDQPQAIQKLVKASSGATAARRCWA